MKRIFEKSVEKGFEKAGEKGLATWTGEMMKTPSYPSHPAEKINYPIDPTYNLPVITPSSSSGHIYVCYEKLIGNGTLKICIGILTSSSKPLVNVGGHTLNMQIYPKMLSRTQYDGSSGYQFFFPYAKPYLINITDISNSIDATEFMTETSINDILDTYENLCLPLLNELQ